MIPLVLGIQLLSIFAGILLIRRLNQMATRADLNTALDGVTALLGSLSAAIAALIAKVGAGADFQAELDKVTAINAAIQAAIAQASA